jgi:hypothetical protein
VLNEVSIITGQAQEVSDVLTVLRLRPIHYHTTLMLLGVDAVIVNVKAAKINILTRLATFCTLALGTRLGMQSKHFSAMYDVFRHCMAVNHIIIKV